MQQLSSQQTTNNQENTITTKLNQDIINNHQQHTSPPLVYASPLDKLKVIKEKTSESDKNQEKRSNQGQSQPTPGERREEHSRGRLSRSREKKKHRKHSKKHKKQSQNQNTSPQSESQTMSKQEQAQLGFKQKQFKLLVKQLLGDSKQSIEDNNLFKNNQQARRPFSPMVIPKDQTWDSVPTESEPPRPELAQGMFPNSQVNLCPTNDSKQFQKFGKEKVNLQVKLKEQQVQCVPIQSICSVYNQSQVLFPSFGPSTNIYSHYPPYYYEQFQNGTQKQKPLLDKSQRNCISNRQTSPDQVLGLNSKNNKSKPLLSQRQRYYKTRLCFDFKMGRCSKSKEECNFAHGEDDIRRPKSNNLCRNFQKGFCKKTQAECKFVHAMANDDYVTSFKEQGQQEVNRPEQRKACEVSKESLQRHESDKMNSAYLPSHSRVSSQQYLTSQDNHSYFSGHNSQFNNYGHNQHQPSYPYQNYPFLPPYYHNGFNQRLSHQNLPQYNPYYMHYPINAYQRGPEYQEDIRVNTPLDQNTSLPLYAQYPFVGSGFNPNFHMRPAFCDERAKVNLHYSLEGGDMGQERRFDTKKQ